MYRFIFTLALLFIIPFLQAQDISEKEIDTQVEEAIVFLDGAQIVRTYETQLEKGMHELKFTGLSPHIDANSIRVKADGPLTVLNVEHKPNYLEEERQSEKRPQLKNQIKDLNDSLDVLIVQNEIIESQLGFLYENRKQNGTTQISNLKEAAKYHKEQITKLKMEQLEINALRSRLEQKRNRLKQELGQTMNITEPTSSEIHVNIDMKSSGKVDFEINYLVNGAGWYPTYDIRANSINAPVQFVYKANVRQHTGVDWTDVQLTFSSAQPSANQRAPKLQPYFLDYYGYETRNRNFDKIRGKVIDQESGDPIIFASVNVSGTSIGTETDLDGNFSLMLPKGKNYITLSYVGYQTKVVRVTSPYMKLELASGIKLEEAVEVVDYKVPLIKDIQALGKTTAGGYRKAKQSADNYPIPLHSEERLLNFEFAIEMPYSIPSQTNKRTLEMKRFEVPAHFHYYAVPKLDQYAYLIAEVKDWQKFQLIPGEAQLYFENTYIGKSLIDPTEAGDTLSFSMGPDKNLSVERELIKDYSEHRFFGSRTEVTKAFRIIVQNNKSEPITITVADQVPISKIEKVKVEVLETSGVTPHPETGKVEWTMQLGPKDKGERNLRYEVTVPRGKGRIVE